MNTNTAFDESYKRYQEYKARTHTYTITVEMDGVIGDDEDDAIDRVFECLSDLSYAIRLVKIEQEDE